MKKKFVFAQIVPVIVLILGNQQTHAATPSGSATCFRAHNFDDGTLCFSVPLSSIAPQTNAEVTIDHSSQHATFAYESLGASTEQRCIHTKEGPHCFDAPVLLFRRLILGGQEDIEIDLPGLQRGNARIGGFSYDLYAEEQASLESRSYLESASFEENQIGISDQAAAAGLCTRSPICCPPLGITEGCRH